MVSRQAPTNRNRFHAAGMIAAMGKGRAISEVVAENLGRLIGYDRSTGRSRIPQDFLAKKGVSQATIGRILRDEVNARIQTIAVIARHFELQPWQLLVDGFDPKPPPAARKGRVIPALFLSPINRKRLTR